MNVFRNVARQLPSVQEVMHASWQDHLHDLYADRRCDAFVLDAQLRQSLVTVRSLGRQNLRIAAAEATSYLDKARYLPTFASRWCQASFWMPPIYRDGDRFIDQLIAHIQGTKARVVIPSSDGTIAAIRLHRAEVERYARVALASEAALEVAINKEKTLTVAQALGINIPRGIYVQSVDEIKSVINTIGLPAVVKPVESWVWEGQNGVRLVCQLVTTFDEAFRTLERYVHNGGSVLYQQFLTGRREAVSLFYAQNTVFARFAQWAKRTHPPLGGVSTYRQSIALPEDITAQAERLVRELELEGYSEVEFRRDDLGRPYLMEINPRLSASIEVAVRAGVDFPYLLYRWACGEPISHISGYRTGLWMRYLEGDLLSLFQALRQHRLPGMPSPLQTLQDLVLAGLVPASYDYLAWDDLRPAWYALKDLIYRLVWKCVG